MKRRNIITLIIVFILMMILFANFSSVKATSLGDVVTSAENIRNAGKTSWINYDNLYTVVDFLYNAAMIIGMIIAIIVGTGLGIRIIFGSIDQQADAKKLLVPYLVTVSVLAFSYTIWKAVVSIISSNI